MRKTLIRAKDTLSDYIFNTILDGQRRGKMVDGYYIADSTQDLKKVLRLNSVEVCHFVKRYVQDVNFGNQVITIERRAGNNGSNLYKVEDLNVNI